MQLQPKSSEIEALLTKVAKGDHRALRGLYDCVGADLYGVAVSLVEDESAAADILTDVFERVWQMAGMMRANGVPPHVWLLTLTRDTAVAHLRQQRRNKGIPAALDITERLYATDAPNAGGSAEAVQLQACLLELPPDRASWMERAYKAGMTYEDLAEITGKQGAELRAALRRSVLQLRECLSR